MFCFYRLDVLSLWNVVVQILSIEDQVLLKTCYPINSRIIYDDEKLKHLKTLLEKKVYSCTQINFKNFHNNLMYF